MHMKLNQCCIKCFFPVLFSCMVTVSYAQDTSVSYLSKGHLYGQVFGDYYYKSHADSTERGSYQYSKLRAGSNAFQLRRITLGYAYDISSKFTADVMVESLAGNGNTTFFIKYANLRWKEIFPKSDLIIGRMKTPTFSTVIDKIWNYRSVERTVADMRGSPSYDLGIMLSGHLDKNNQLGYNLMAGNGKGNSLTDDRFKKFYGEIFFTFLEEKILIDIYSDYERYFWQKGFHQSAAMLKGAIAYQSPDFTIGVESYLQYLQNSTMMGNNTSSDTINTKELATSLFMHGNILKDKLGFFARIDHINPFTNFKSSAVKFTSLMASYEPANANHFISAGLDFTPVRNVHIMPNIWYCHYKDLISPNQDYDLVYRLTFFYKFDR